MTISADPVILCEMKVYPYRQVEVDLTIRINDDMKWRLFVRSCKLNSSICPLLGNLTIHFENMESALLMIQKHKGELTWKIYFCINVFICSYDAQKTCFNK